MNNIANLQYLSKFYLDKLLPINTDNSIKTTLLEYKNFLRQNCNYNYFPVLQEFLIVLQQSLNETTPK